MNRSCRVSLNLLVSAGAMQQWCQGGAGAELSCCQVMPGQLGLGASRCWAALQWCRAAPEAAKSVSGQWTEVPGRCPLLPGGAWQCQGKARQFGCDLRGARSVSEQCQGDGRWCHDDAGVAALCQWCQDDPGVPALPRCPSAVPGPGAPEPRVSGRCDAATWRRAAGTAGAVFPRPPAEPAPLPGRPKSPWFGFGFWFIVF